MVKMLRHRDCDEAGERFAEVSREQEKTEFPVEQRACPSLSGRNSMIPSLREIRFLFNKKVGLIHARTRAGALAVVAVGNGTCP